jgi:hypothetical protein
MDLEKEFSPRISRMGNDLRRIASHMPDTNGMNNPSFANSSVSVSISVHQWFQSEV